MIQITKRLLSTVALVVVVTFSSCIDPEAKATYIPAPVEKPTAYTPPPFKSMQEWTYNLNMYEANVRQYTKEGTFNAFRAHVPRLKDMGVGIVWFMPIHPIGEKNRLETLGSYYAVKDFKKINPEFGSLTDFKSLVDEIHKQGMYVIIDWVPNHTAWDNVLTTSNPEFYTKDGNGNFMPPAGTSWSDVIDLDYSKQGLRDYMIGAMKYWVIETGIDGFRCDAADMVPNDFWVEATTELKKVYPGIFMLAEAPGKEMYNGGFHMTFAWPLHGFQHGVLKDVYNGTKNANDMDNFVKSEQVNFSGNNYRLYFTSNHDENSWQGTEYEQFGAAAEAFAVFTQTFNSMPLIYSGQEAAMKKRLAFFKKDEIIWPATPDPIQSVYSKLGSLKRRNKALWNGEAGGKAERVATSDPSKAYAFKREKDTDKIVVVMNLSNTATTVTLSETVEGAFINVMTAEERQLIKDGQITLTAWGYQVYEKKP